MHLLNGQTLLNQAKENIRIMHGMYRQPTLLKRVDQVCKFVQSKPGRKKIICGSET